MCNRKFRVGVLGLGISNISLLGLDRFRDCDITVRSRGPIDPSVLPRHLNIRRITVGNSWLDRIDEDLLIASPSVRRDAPELTNAVKRGCVITSDAEIFFDNKQYGLLKIVTVSTKNEDD
jgi:UDP-N-acetylmuramoylalanine-D-glutamate ligase